MSQTERDVIFQELMRTVIEEINQIKGLMRADRNVRITLHITGTKLAQTELSIFTRPTTKEVIQ